MGQLRQLYGILKVPSTLKARMGEIGKALKASAQESESEEVRDSLNLARSRSTTPGLDDDTVLVGDRLDE